MKFQFGKSNHPSVARASRNEETIVLLALLPDPLGENPSDAAIRRNAERVDRALARLGGRSPGRRGRIVVQRSASGHWACKQQAKYKRRRVAAQHGARSPSKRSGRK